MQLPRFLSSGARLTALVLSLASASLQAADPALDSAFVTELSPGLTPTGYPSFDSGTGAVNAVTLQTDGKILAGGNVSRYKTSGAVSALKRLLPTGALDTSFNSGGSGLAASQGHTEVNALLRVANDKLYVGGTFSSYNGVARSGLLRLNADGSLDSAFNASGLGGVVRYALALAEQPDGKLLVGGGFSSVNSTARANLARLNADGSLDTAFNPAALAGSSFVGDIALLPDGDIVVAGGRTRAGGGGTPLLVRLNPDGSLDSSLAPAFADEFGDIDELVVLPDGRLLIGGDFTFSPSGAFHNFACLLPDGSLDTAFMANLGTGPDGWAGGEILLQPDGTVLVGGIFKAWNGQPRASVARVNQDGTLEASFSPAPYVNDNSYLTHFYAFAVQPDGKLVAGGWLNRVTDPAVETYNLTRFVNEFAPSAPGALRLLSATATTAENAGSVTLQVSRFGGTAGAVSVQFATSHGGPAGTANAGTDYTTTTGTLSWAAGEGGFKTITVPVLQDAAAEAAETFTVTLSAPTGGATVPAANAKTLVTLRDDDSPPAVTLGQSAVSLEQGARFSLSVRYDSVLPATVKWQRDPDGAGPLGFTDLTDTGGFSGTTTTVLTVAAADPALHAGSYRAVVTNAVGAANSSAAAVGVSVPAGSVVNTTSSVTFTQAPLAATLDASDRPLVLITGTSGSDPARLLRLVRGAGNPAPIQTDSTFTPATFTSIQGSTTTSGAPGTVVALADGKILVGGFFSQVNGTARASLARLLSTGALDTTFNPVLPTIANGFTITSVVLAPSSGGKLYAGFDSNGGLRRYLADGTLDPAFGPNTNAAFFGSSTNLNNSVTALLETPDGHLYVAHRYSSSSFGGTLSYPVWRLKPDGTRDTTFADPAAAGVVTSLALLPDGRLALGGHFPSVNGQALTRLAVVQTDGKLDPGFYRNPGFPAGVRQLFYRDGRLFAFGEYEVSGATPRALRRYNLDGGLDASFAVGDGANGRIAGAAFTSTGEMFLAGSFTQVKGVARDKLAYLVGNPHIGAVGFTPSRRIEIERGEILSLTLHRYGPATEAISLRYATADADTTSLPSSITTATAGADYLGASGTVSWAAGDTADKTVSIQLFNDDAVESTERFRVVLSDPSGPVTAAAAITVELLDDDTPPTFINQPFSSTRTAGSNLNLSATVNSPTPTTYQWFLNGVAIPGATALAYSKPVIGLADAGLYTLVATNAAGSFPSAAAHVVVTPVAGKVAPGQATTGRPTFNANPAALLALPDGGALVGGAFTAAPASNVPQAHLIRIRADGSTDTTFTITLNGTVTALLRQPDGKILVGGAFNTLGGSPQRGVLRLNADLSPDTAFNTAAATGLTTGEGSVSDLAVDSTGRVYASTAPATFRAVYRFAANGTPDSTYVVSAIDRRVSAQIRAIAIASDDKLILAGSFFSITANSDPAVSQNRIARLSPSGVVDAAFAPAVGSFNFNDLLITSAGRLFAAGSESSTSLFEINPDGSSTVSSLASGNQVYEIAFGPDGRLALARASINGSGSISRLNLPANFGNTPTADTTFNVGTGPNGDVHSLAYAADGTLWLAGVFTNFDGFASGGVVRLQGSVGDPGIVNPPARADANAGATARFAVGATGTNLTYQWFKNGAPLANDSRISGVTTAVLSISGLIPADADNYTVQVTGGSPATTVTSGPARLNVLGTPVVAASPASVSPALGSTLTLAADVLAASPATYVWRRDGVLIIDGGRYSGATTGMLVITGTNASDNGAYTLTVTNGLGTASTTPATITVAQVATDRDPATTALSATSRAYTFLHLGDGRTLVGSQGQVTGAASTSTTTKLSIIEADGRVTASALGIFNSQVTRLVRQPDGKILVMGGFTAIGSNSGAGFTRFVRLNADLTRDTAFAAYLPNDAPTNAVVDAQGRIYLVGPFVNYEGRSGQNFLVRLNPDGTHDQTFILNLNNSVLDIALQPDGKILVAGNFTSYGAANTPAKGLLRLNADGTVDTGFASAAIPAAAIVGNITALAVDSQSRILVGYGYFVSGWNYGVARLLPSGALDSAFTFSQTLNNAPTLLVPTSDGKTLVAGNLFPPGLYRLNADGTTDTAFTTALGDSFGVSAANLRAIVPDANGRFWIGGDFTTFKGASAPGILVLQGSGAPAIAFTAPPAGRTTDLGGTATFTAAATANNGFTFQWLKNGAPLANSSRISGVTTATLTISGLLASDTAAYTVRVSTPASSLVSPAATLAVLDAPEILTSPAALTRELGGSAAFTATARGAGTLAYRWLHGSTELSDGTVSGVTIAGATTPSLTVSGLTFAQAGEYRLRVTNSLGSATTPPAVLTVERRPGGLAPGVAGTLSANNPVLAILRLADGSMLVGGQFTSILVNGVGQTRNRLARFLSDGTLDPAFTPNFNGDVRALAQDSAGRIFVGGNFTSVTFGSTTTNRTRVARLTSALALDTAFDTSAAGPNGSINAVAPTNDGGVYVGGAFGFNLVGTATVNRVARLSATGALDTGFSAPASPVNNEVKALLRRTDGKLYVAGTFGTTLLSAAGVRDTAFNAEAPSILAVQGQALLLLADGSLLLGANGGLPQPYLRRLNANTGVTLNNYGSLHGNQVSALAQQADGKLLSGSITGFARSDLAGTADTGFSAFNNTISALAVDGAGRIWVGGSFTSYGSVVANRLAVLAGGDFESRDGLLTPQTITFPAITDRTFGLNAAANTVALSATSSAGLTPITFAVTSGPATVSGSTLTVTGAGSVTVTASHPGNATFAAGSATRTFTVAKAAQTITFAALPAKTVTSPAFTVSATASSGLPVSFSVSGPATLAGNTVTLTGAAGTVTVTASQAGDANFAAATAVPQSFNVTAGDPQTITFAALPNRLAGAKFTLAATSTPSGLPVSFSIVSGPATLGTDGKSVTIGATAGTVTIRASQAGGTNAGKTYAAATPVDQSFEVTLGPPTRTQKITFTKPTGATYGQAPVTLSASADSGLAVTFSVVSGPATVSGARLTFTGAGNVVVRASQPGNAIFKPATAVSQTIAVAKAPLTVTFADATRLVRAPNPVFTPVYSGFVDDDTAADLAATRPTGTTTAKATSKAGRYPITLSGGVDANYRFVAGEPAFLTVVGFGGAFEAVLVDSLGTVRGKVELLVPVDALTYSGVLQLASEPAALTLKGNLTASSGAAATARWTRTTNGLAELILTLGLAADTLTGELSVNGEPALTLSSGARLYVQPVVAGKKQNAPWIGQHTLIARDPLPLVESDVRPLPLGAGHATAVIAATGVLTVTGKLADGTTTLTTTAKADASGRYRLYARPYAKRLDSFLAGQLAFKTHPNQTRFPGRHLVPETEGRLFWAKAALPGSTAPAKRDKAYRQGFATELVAFVDPWLAPSTRSAVSNGVTVPAGTLAQRLGLASTATAASTVRVTFTLGESLDLGARAAFLPTTLNLSAAGVFGVPTPQPAAANNPAFTLKVTPATGLLSGSFTLRDQVGGKAIDRKVTVTGTLRQGPDQNASLAHAQFLLDPVPGDTGDTAAVQVSGELLLTPPAR